MADLLDIESALATLIGGVIYPNGAGQAAATSVDCKIYPGWPNESELAVSLAANQAEISIYSGQNLERVSTRFMRDWSDLVKGVATITATVAGRVITLSGSITVGNYVTAIIANQSFSCAVIAGDTLTSISTKLAALFPTNFGAVVAGATITLAATWEGRIAVYTAAPGTVSREINRQDRGMLVTIWAPSPQARASIATLLMTAILKTDFLPLTDGSAAWLRYRQSNESDGKENAMAYRRDVGLWVEYAALDIMAGYPITAPVLTGIGAPYIYNPPGSIVASTAALKYNLKSNSQYIGQIA